MFLFWFSFFVVALGQPAHIGQLSTLVAWLGLTLFWISILKKSKKRRFWLGWFWFTGVQLIQLSWFFSHPFPVILFAYAITALVMGLPMGLLVLHIDSSRPILVAACWALLEWLRLFLFSGYTWNPMGLYLTHNIYSLQLASIVGVFGLSFWVILTNTLGLKAWLYRKNSTIFIWCIACFLPFIYGYGQIRFNQVSLEQSKKWDVLLVQPNFSVFENDVVEMWQKLLTFIAPYSNHPLEMVIFPEAVLPLQKDHYFYPLDQAKKIFVDIFGDEINSAFATVHEKNGHVNHVFFAQTIANFFNAKTIIGLESKSFNAAHYFTPLEDSKSYAKQVLVPLGEYIPFSWCRTFAAKYGVVGSFEKGTSCSIWDGIGVSICYEETFGHMMRQNKKLGATLLVNLTNDGWYPASSLERQHCDLSRLRTVENGFPLVRSCNTGITCAFDALGRSLGSIDSLVSGAFVVQVPSHTFSTLYTFWGDYFIVGLSLLIILCELYHQFRKINALQQK